MMINILSYTNKSNHFFIASIVVIYLNLKNKTFKHFKINEVKYETKKKNIHDCRL